MMKIGKKTAKIPLGKNWSQQKGEDATETATLP
jgi:hypothetical protein